MKKKYLTFCIPLLAIICYVLFYLFTIPNFIFLRSDDFGYIDSLVLSLKNHKIVTSQFLEPPNLFSTFIGYALFHLTKSFYLAVIIPIFISSILTFTFIFLLFKSFYKYLHAILPTVVNITFDATGIVTSWLLFILAIYLWEKKQIALFFAIAFFAVINRQSNLVLLLFHVHSLIA